MNCWKSVNINRDYGLHRLIIISLLISFFYFVIFYELLSLLFPKVHYKEISFINLILSMLLVLPFHKLLHCVPIWLMGKKAYLQIKFSDNMFPMIYCKYPTVLTKRTSLIATITPTLLITTGSITGGVLFPEYIPLISIFSTLNIALCVTDAIYVMHLWNAPRSAFFEDNYNTFHILTKEIS
jgi:hypothetical protein